MHSILILPFPCCVAICRIFVHELKKTSLKVLGTILYTMFITRPKFCKTKPLTFEQQATSRQRLPKVQFIEQPRGNIQLTRTQFIWAIYDS